MDKKTLSDEDFRKLIEEFGDAVSQFTSKESGRHIIIIGVDHEGVSAVMQGSTRDLGEAFMRMYAGDEHYRTFFSTIAKAITMWEMLGPNACGAFVDSAEKLAGRSDAEQLAKTMGHIKADA